MSTTGIIVTVVVVIAIALSVAATWDWGVLRCRRLRHRFGPEYDRALEEQPNRSAAEHKLRAREQRHDELDLTPLSAQDQRRYSQEWTHACRPLSWRPRAVRSAPPMHCLTG